MVDLLVFVKSFIEVALTAGRTPKNVPLVRLCWGKASGLKHRSDQFIVKSWHFVEELAILDVVAFLIAIELHVICDHLFFCDVFENQEIGLVFVIEVI